MAKKKVHNLKTIEDMCRIVTEENYVRLVMDMADCIGFHIKLKRELTKKEYSELKAFTAETGIEVEYLEDYNDNNEFYAKQKPKLLYNIIYSSDKILASSPLKSNLVFVL